MAEKRSNKSIDLTTSPPSTDQHDETTTFDETPGHNEAKEQGSDPPGEAQDHEYLSGVRLFLVLAGLTLAVFLMLLDASIVATVSLRPLISSLTTFPNWMEFSLVTGYSHNY